ncbi:HCNGP-like protein-domain containing protein [Rhodotorula toruloides]|uniref:HCNGP-like protein-domain containing protein n=1 Tax=Rhodotorula toruloides TaxID=5286 RepID=A0A2S9ZVN6_RHOTO|nr:HCNGP-like protein-domain containing protein [Rhodotorula toruloides]
MQNLAGYGSDSDSDSERDGRAASAVAGSSGARSQATSDTATAPPAAPPALNRIKGAASRSQSPLVGVRLPTSTTNSPRPSSIALGKRRESSTSPPRFEREGQDGRGDAGRRQASTEYGSEDGSRPAPSVKLDTLAEFGIPPVPTGPCKPSVEAKLTNFHNLRVSRGLHFNDSLHASKAFRNPRIYAKLVDFVDVDETGTNWDKEIWDPKNIGADASATRIAELQKLRSEAKQATAGQRTSIAFTAPSTSASRSRDDDRPRHRDDRDRPREKERDRGKESKRSRWDRVVRDRSRSPRRR